LSRALAHVVPIVSLAKFVALAVFMAVIAPGRWRRPFNTTLGRRRVRLYGFGKLTFVRRSRSKHP
jgi:hypothetical protein